MGDSNKVIVLIDLQQLNKMKSLSGPILQIIPLETNYLVCPDISKRIIVSVSKSYTSSTRPLKFHLELQGATQSCYLRFKNSDLKIIKEFLDLNFC